MRSSALRNVLSTTFEASRHGHSHAASICECPMMCRTLSLAFFCQFELASSEDNPVVAKLPIVTLVPIRNFLLENFLVLLFELCVIFQIGICCLSNSQYLIYVDTPDM